MKVKKNDEVKEELEEWDETQGGRRAAKWANSAKEKRAKCRQTEGAQWKTPPYVLLTFLCAGLEIAAGILFSLYAYICLLRATTDSVSRLSSVPSATARPPSIAPG